MRLLLVETGQVSLRSKRQLIIRSERAKGNRDGMLEVTLRICPPTGIRQGNGKVNLSPQRERIFLASMANA